MATLSADGSCSAAGAAASSAARSSRPSRMRLKIETNAPRYSRGRSMPAMNARTEGRDNCSSLLRSSCLRTRCFSSVTPAADRGGLTRTSSSAATSHPWLARSHRTQAAAARLATPEPVHARRAALICGSSVADSQIARASARKASRSAGLHVGGAGSWYELWSVISPVHESSKHVRPSLPETPALVGPAGGRPRADLSACCGEDGQRELLGDVLIPGRVAHRQRPVKVPVERVPGIQQEPQLPAPQDNLERPGAWEGRHHDPVPPGVTGGSAGSRGQAL